MDNIRIYIDGTLIEKNPGGLEDFNIVVEREGGFESTAQILREKIDTAGLTFTCDGYDILGSIKAAGLCNIHTILFEQFCGGVWQRLFKGTFQLKNIKLSLGTRTALLDGIKDSSFSGLIQDNADTEVPLYATRTKGCEPLSLVDADFVFNKASDGSTDEFTAKGFDALALLQYIVSYLSDNAVEVRSDYLTNNKIGFTKGFNLHNTTGSTLEVYGKQALQWVFTELRKKRRLYMVVESDAGQPVLRIEQESYSYDDTTELGRFDEIPVDAVEEFDEKRVYNTLEVGSTTTELQDDAEPVYPQDSLTSWIKETFNNCGGCTKERFEEGVKLDLVSSAIIDTNILYEALNTPIGDEYTNDEAWVMFEYHDDSGINRVTQTNVSGVYIYNAGFRNQQVIEAWMGYAPLCVAERRSAKYGFLVSNPGQVRVCYAAIPDTAVVDAYTQNNLAFYENYDEEGRVTTDIALPGTNPYSIFIPNTGPTTDSTSYFKAEANGNYEFEAKATFELFTDDLPGVFFLSGADPAIEYILRLCVYQDDTFSTLITQYDKVVSAAFTISSLETKSLVLNPGSIALSAGNCVFVKKMVHVTGTNSGGDSFFEIVAKNYSFRLISDDFDCEDFEQPEIPKANLLRFREEMCFNDRKALIANKRGYYMVKGRKFFVEKIVSNMQDAAEYLLRGDTSLYNC